MSEDKMEIANGARQGTEKQENAQSCPVAIIDLGTNSLRMIIVRILADSASGKKIQKNKPGAVILNEVKQMVRLGEGAFLSGHLQPESMRRTLDALKGFADMCAAYHTREIVAFATSAVRDAANGEEFLARIKEKTGLDFTVISGTEEARLIYKGINSEHEKSKTQRVIMDIGGGSTEFIVGDSFHYSELDSIKVGSVRLANIFFEGDSDPVRPEEYAVIQNYVRNHALHAFARINACSPQEFIASSGTAQNLAEIAAALALADETKDYDDTKELLTYKGLKRVVRELCSRTEEERKLLPGINVRRAGILIPGAAIMQTAMEELSFDEVHISGKGLRDGILEEYLEKQFPDVLQTGTSTREDSVFKLARFCNFEEEHSLHVAQLAISLFDSAKKAGLHDLSDNNRELLYFAAILHDIGIFIAFSQHHAHSYYLIKNTELLGFTRREINTMALIAFFHRNRPTQKSPCFAELEKKERQEIRLLSLFLALAESMDKSHCGLIKNARFRLGDAFSNADPSARSRAFSPQTSHDNSIKKSLPEPVLIDSVFTKPACPESDFKENLSAQENSLFLDLYYSSPCPVELERLKKHEKAIYKCFGTMAQIVKILINLESTPYCQ